MTDAFQSVLDMSYSASWLIIVILALRLLLRRMPKSGNVLLWGLAALRLLLPFTIESRFSLIPAEFHGSDVHGMDNIEFALPNELLSINPDIHGNFSSVSDPLYVFSIVWMIGILGFALFFVISYFRFMRRLDTAILLRENIYQSDMIDTSVVIGILRPKICVPFKVSDSNLNHIIAHERSHIRRRDHLWKLVAYIALMIHWFNPLVWIAYCIFGRDIELACDEAVIRALNWNDRADYAQTLVTYSTCRRTPNLYPLYFGEIGVKVRVKSVMNFKRFAVWHYVLLTALCLLLCCCFLTNPARALETPEQDTMIQDAQQLEAETEPRSVKDLTGLELEKKVGNQQNAGLDEKPGDLQFELAVRRQLDFYEKELEYLKLQIAKTEAQYRRSISADRPPLKASMERFAYLIEQLEARIQIAKEQLGME